jgi:hypothetical protein
MRAQSPPVLAQRCHEMRNFFGEPDHRPLDASKVCPTIGTP